MKWKKWKPHLLQYSLCTAGIERRHYWHDTLKIMILTVIQCYVCRIITKQMWYGRVISIHRGIITTTADAGLWTQQHFPSVSRDSWNTSRVILMTVLKIIIWMMSSLILRMVHYIFQGWWLIRPQPQRSSSNSLCLSAPIRNIKDMVAQRQPLSSIVVHLPTMVPFSCFRLFWRSNTGTRGTHPEVRKKLLVRRTPDVRTTGVSKILLKILGAIYIYYTVLYVYIYNIYIYVYNAISTNAFDLLHNHQFMQRCHSGTEGKSCEWRL